VPLYYEQMWLDKKNEGCICGAFWTFVRLMRHIMGYSSIGRSLSAHHHLMTPFRRKWRIKIIIIALTFSARLFASLTARIEISKGMALC
jgi:hypothetical protein